MLQPPVDALRNSGRGVLLVGATNQYDKLDAALKRAGRFDTHIEVLDPTTPDERGCCGFI